MKSCDGDLNMLFSCANCSSKITATTCPSCGFRIPQHVVDFVSPVQYELDYAPLIPFDECLEFDTTRYKGDP